MSLRAVLQRSQHPSRRLEWVVAVAVLLLAVAYGLFIFRSGLALGVVYPLGSDGPLWFDSARLVASGGTVGMPPVYPRLVSWLGIGPPTVAAALRLNAILVSLTLLGAAVGAAASAGHPWLRLAAALGAPLVVMTAADPAVYAWFVHPEVLITALLVWSGALAALYVRDPSWRTAAALGVCCGIAMGAKEHGLPVALSAPAVVLLSGPPGRARWRRLGAMALAMLPFLIDQLFSGSLLAKALGSLQESLSWVRPQDAGLEHFPIEMSLEQQQQVRDGHLFQVYFGQLIQASREWWPVYIAAIVAELLLLARRQWGLALALALPLLSLAPAVVVWTESRHYLVVAPAATLLVVGAAARLRLLLVALPGPSEQ